MAQDKDQETDGSDDAPSATEAVEQREPDEAMNAEDAIHAYANRALADFRQAMDGALDQVLAWVQGARSSLDLDALAPQLGDAFMHEILNAYGGMDAPIGAAAFNELDGNVDEIVREEHDAGSFVEALRRAVRNFDWYLQDNLQSVLSHHWDQLRDLAYEGETQFVAPLHALGLPRPDWSADGLRDGLIAVGETVREQQPKSADEAIERDAEAEQEERERALQEADDKAQQA